MQLRAGEIVKVIIGPFGCDWERVRVVREEGNTVTVYSYLLQKEIIVSKRNVFPDDGHH